MDLDKSLDENKIIAAVLHDVFAQFGHVVFDSSARRNTLCKVKQRADLEGIGFLTKTLPTLGKALDRALSSDYALNSTDLGFKAQLGSKLPKFLGELFSRVLDREGRPLPEPDARSVGAIRLVCYLFYKYELASTDEQNTRVLESFVRTELELETVSEHLDKLYDAVENTSPTTRLSRKASSPKEIVRRARHLLSDLFAFFDPKDIVPRHGPGAVSTKETLQAKYEWTNISEKITRYYPIEEYFLASMSHLCDDYQRYKLLGNKDLPARVILVPKDSRGSRLISCEPVDFQWIQQGLGRAIVKLAETHPLTRENVRFTDQQPNGFAALMGSLTGRYSTLDLKDASDRVTVSLVRLLFPAHIFEALNHSRSSSTVMPDGMIVPLRKFAPMGSCLCFPIMALSIWALLTAGCNVDDADTRESIYVYGDDVIVPTAYAEDAMSILESFGLKINHDKSCTKGFFRESCGVDAFKGVDVTPVRIRTVWKSSRSPEVYESYIAYANNLFNRSCYTAYELIVENLTHIYGSIPTRDQVYDSAPCLVEAPQNMRPPRQRWNKRFQKTEFLCWVGTPQSVKREMNGWDMLLRFFSEANSSRPVHSPDTHYWRTPYEWYLPIGVRKYTMPRSSMLERRWR